MTRWDVLLVICLVAVAALTGTWALMPSAQGDIAVVSVGGEVVCRMPLNRNASADIGEGKLNTIAVEGGIVRITAANCPDKLCMGKTLRYTGDALVCLPHKLSVTIEGEGGWDAVIP